MPRTRDIAMVFQNYALYPHMTVYENMAFSLKLKKAPKEEIDRKVPGKPSEILDMARTWTGGPRPSPAASGSGWPSAGPSSGTPRSS